MSDDELKLTRRLFLQHAAMASAVTAGWCGIAVTTDALSQDVGPMLERGDDLPSPYPYIEHTP